MATGPRYIVKYRRRRQGKTNYSKRVKLLKSRLLRLIIRKSNKFITIQLADFDVKGDKIVLSASSNELKKLGWKHSTSNLPAAYLTGLLLGGKALKANIKKAIFDIGLYRPTKGSKLFAALKGVADAGIDIQINEKNLPDETRISGKHISEEITKDFGSLKTKLLPSEGAKE